METLLWIDRIIKRYYELLTFFNFICSEHQYCNKLDSGQAPRHSLFLEPPRRTKALTLRTLAAPGVDDLRLSKSPKALTHSPSTSRTPDLATNQSCTTSIFGFPISFLTYTSCKLLFPKSRVLARGTSRDRQAKVVSWSPHPLFGKTQWISWTCLNKCRTCSSLFVQMMIMNRSIRYSQGLRANSKSQYYCVDIPSVIFCNLMILRFQRAWPNESKQNQSWHLFVKRDPELPKDRVWTS